MAVERGGRQYEFVAGGISPFAYLEFYEALAKLRRAEEIAVSFDVDPSSKEEIHDSLP